VAWVGDSRAYRLRAGAIEQLTEDHSIVAELVRRSLIRPEEAASHPRRSELLRCIGAASQLEVDLQRIEVVDGDRFLLCSDGLWGQVSDTEIAAVAAVETPERAVARLVELANQRGGPDNITVQIVALSGAQPRRSRSATSLPTDPAPAGPLRALRPSSRVVLALFGSALAVAAALAGLIWLASAG
jgi:serine/threonine protein phosphatase PrpC